MAQVLDGKVVAELVRARVREQAAALLVQRGIVPRLTAVLVGDDPASQTYVGIKQKSCAKEGLGSDTVHLPAATSREELLAVVARLNAAPEVHGILVQLPLPPHLDANEVVLAIDPRKDVDGLHPVNGGLLLQDRPGMRPCTPAGIMEMLDHYGVELAGRRAVVVGRSNIVGKPMALMLLHRHATVTICHSRTQDLAGVTRQADVLVIASGQRGLIGPEHVKRGAAVVDVGMHRLPDGKLDGDVQRDQVAQVAGWLTPVPGGVGPMTVAMLLHNTVAAARVLSSI